MRIAAGVVAVLLLAGGVAHAKPRKRPHHPRPTPAAGSEAEGRAHLKKAATLASHGNCEAAIEEYTLAFDRLNDPAVLLARADCRQKVGQNAEAIDDYRAYLDESPDVGNRAEIEAKIAALEGAPAKGAPPAAKEAPIREPAPKEAPSPRETAPKEAARPKETPRPAESPAPPPSPPPAPAEAEERPRQEPLVTAAATTEAGAGESRPASHGRPWLWVALAVLVAGGIAASSYLYFQPKSPTPPATELGNYHF
jgi:hypothetical protein